MSSQNSYSQVAYPQCASHRSQKPQQVHTFMTNPSWRRDSLPYPHFRTPLLSPMLALNPPHQDYPSPAPSMPSPGPHNSQSLDHYPQMQHQSMAVLSNDSISSPFTQIEPSFGPSRVTTRRQASIISQGPLTRRASMPSNLLRREKDHHRRTHSATLVQNGVEDIRPQTPNSGAMEGSQLELSIGNPDQMMLPSSSYHPATPTSLASPFSPYDQYHPHSRSASCTTPAVDARPASPALSAISAYTATSSGSGMRTIVFPPAPQDSPAEDNQVRPKHKKSKLKDIDRKKICLARLANPNARQEDIAKEFDVERSTVSKIWKEREKWLSIQEGTERTAKHRPSKFPEIEEEMMKILQECTENETFISDSFLRSKARGIAKQLLITEDKFKASSGWIENFKNRHGVKGGVWVGRGRSVRTGHQRSVGMMDNATSSALLSPITTPFGGHITSINSVRFPSRDNDDNDTNDHRGESSSTHNSSNSQNTMDMNSWQDPASITPRQQSIHPHQPAASEGTSHHAPPSQSPLVPHPPEPAPELQQHVDDETPSHSLTQYQPPLVYNPALTLYQSVPDNTAPPTIAEAEQALNRVIAFFDTSGRDIIQDNEREVLNTIKCALFQHASGIPYTRPS